MQTEYNKPVPDIESEPTAKEFWEGLREEKLLLQKCGDCDEHQFFFRPWCHYCGSEDISLVESEGVGTVFSQTTIRRAVRIPQFSEDIPYAVGHVQLAEGPRMLTRFVNCEAEKIERGIEVEVVFDEVTDEVTLPHFQPRE